MGGDQRAKPRLGGVDVPLYLTSPPQDLAYILKDAGVTFVAVSGREQLAKILAIAGDLPALSYLLLLDDGPKDETRLGQLPALGLDGLCARGEQQHGGVSQPVAAPGLATIIYTSGTTGLPKGVMLTHANILANTQDAVSILPITEDDLTLSFLPLSHGFERMAGLYTLLRAGASIAYGGGTVTLTNDLGEVKPTLLSCVPRVLELGLQERLRQLVVHSSSPARTRAMRAFRASGLNRFALGISTRTVLAFGVGGIPRSDLQ